MRRGSVALSWGRWGGCYLFHADDVGLWRVCLGWVALTYMAVEIDDLIEAYAEYWTES